MGNAARPGGILSVTGEGPLQRENAAGLKDDWQQLFSGQGQSAGAGRIAVFSGDMNFEQVEPPMRDSEFLAQRELAAKETARAMRVPAWAIDAPTGDSMTYANVQQQARHLIDFSLRPWIVRLEQAISGDTDLCPGSTYFTLDTGEFLRFDLDARAQYYERALNPETGWMARAEVRAELDLPPEGS